MSEWGEALRQATATTFEDMCFMLPEPPEEGGMPAVEIAAFVRFDGHRSGSLAIFIRGELVQSMVANMLGDDEALSEQDRVDGVKEVANVICGNALTQTMGEDKVFNLAPPAVFDGERPPYPEPSDVAEVHRAQVQFDEGVVEVMLSVLA